MTYERDMLLDTAANAMIKLYPTTDNIPQVCIRVRDIHSQNVPPILNQYFEAVARGKASNVTRYVISPM